MQLEHSLICVKNIFDEKCNEILSASSAMIDSVDQLYAVFSTYKNETIWDICYIKMK